MRSRFLLINVVTVLVCALIIGISTQALAGPTQQKLASESAIEQILQRGVLRVGMSTFVPWAMKDKKGELIGFEIDMAKRLAQDMGVKIEFVPTKWSGIIPALLTGKFDVIIGGMSIRPDRNLKVNFTIPYDYAGQTICVNKSLAAGFKTVADFNRSDVKIGVRLGSTSVPAVRKFMPKAEMLQFNEEPALYQELLNGKIHAVVASAPTPAFQAVKYPDRLFAITEPLSKELIGFAVRKGDPDTLNYFNNWIRQMEAEGFLQDRHQYWFTTRDWAAQVN
ncbi:MAG: transporter substrate-binding domain-containing protein [Deltaproteobacteria bacterium]|nr:transporter substrate-binding domain-containing protein [Deltaproteobacteria bacterium]